MNKKTYQCNYCGGKFTEMHDCKEYIALTKGGKSRIMRFHDKDTLAILPSSCLMVLVHK